MNGGTLQRQHLLVIGVKMVAHSEIILAMLYRRKHVQKIEHFAKVFKRNKNVYLDKSAKFQKKKKEIKNVKGFSEA